jgi:hypothetical protein
MVAATRSAGDRLRVFHKHEFGAVWHCGKLEGLILWGRMISLRAGDADVAGVRPRVQS